MEANPHASITPGEHPDFFFMGIFALFHGFYAIGNELADDELCVVDQLFAGPPL